MPDDRAAHAPEAPDRNLALELVRVTEAAAMAGGPLGRARRQERRGRRRRQRDAPADHHGVDERRRGDRRGREGQRADALQRRAGRRRQRRRVRRRRRPDRRHHASPPWACPTRSRCIAVAERGSMYDPSAVFYMEKLVTGPEAADVVDINAPVADNIARGRQGQGRAPSRTSPSCILDRPRHEELVREIREAGARIKFITDGDVAGAIMAARDGHRRRPAARHRRHAGGHHRRLRDQVPGRRDPGPAVAAGRRRAAARRSTPATTSTGC